MDNDWMPYANEPEPPQGQLIPFITSPPQLCEEVIKLLGVTEKDKIIDVGCGDGRIVISAVELTHCKGVGIDINQDLIDGCIKEMNEKKLNTYLHFQVDDFSRPDFDFYQCDCVCFYFVPRIIKMMKPKVLEYLRADHSRRCVSIRFPIKNIIPTKVNEAMKLYYYDWQSKEGKYGTNEDDCLLPAF
ncbi:SAM-dependent methyltransferase, putative [Entamoeba histolytica HM-1:IMSS-B]|uniref:SAM-dependent methyltransferase, putative n=8 Tax=Entamoeba TaxID=5758 RepID=C4M647_ENTH1|nr:SAM-dependent methyltransferase, putative [Entamoeba nuttalli P19]XP_655571.1 SAM-dependent methyltransferase, putative [Entamoeba histolytica HM-1:IMSS]EMD43587.1 SAM-dependent methyltransferase, putative [Entamoeba histolytica KU27]EMH73569.1 SAM-dependent methyltransferase, putative [Entamoeba histolytica HM-1:IMSS-B]EMS17647.1 SAM-dependent methyltransferase, putative [Entamoeba histolytica HM-3:IMSS]ENY63750.1 SAM-dependent methyltransferase, putative [Entamoeba histolytica HM-1:IMSS-A|eukprot:XP_008859098.1 SAM-dependent methyltransferase, putative [Entamoeba nuttalli P19]